MSDESDKSDGSDGSDKSDGSDGSDGEVHPCWAASPLYFAKGDPAMDPDRGPFCIARVSRHVVPKTPGLL